MKYEFLYKLGTLLVGMLSLAHMMAAMDAKTTSPVLNSCSLKDKDASKCIYILMQSLLPELKEGLPQYGLESIDPYFFKRGIFRYSNQGIQAALLVKNVFIIGLSNMQIKYISTNATAMPLSIHLKMETQNLTATGHFKANIKFGSFRLAPKGPFNITLGKLKLNMITDINLNDTDDGHRLHMHNLNANLTIEDAFIKANGIFSDQNLNTMMLRLVNENLDDIIRIGVPATRDQWSPVLIECINNYFANVPIDKFLSP